MESSKKTIHSLPSLKKILIIGNGGRENALAWSLIRSEGIEEVFVAPGNGGTEDHLGCKRIPLEATDCSSLISECKLREIELIVIGPEAPLAAGLADKMRQANLNVFGPSSFGAKLEASKDWAKKLMIEAEIPTAHYLSASSKKEALEILKNFGEECVIKADGLASGKGVTVCKSKNQAINAINEAFEGKFGHAGEKLLIEELLQGPEVSVFALTDGKEILVLPPAQDHKRLLENDEGPNTGGMGAYAPAQIINQEEIHTIKQTILLPTLEALISRGIDYRGVIYAGLMITPDGPKVIEFNCRFGDPECQALMPIMGPEFAYILHACALGHLKKAPALTTRDVFTACVVAAANGYPESPKKGDEIFIEATSNESLQIFHAGTKKDISGKLLTSGGRVLSVVGKGENFDQAFEIAYKGLSKIKFDGMNYRKDIGNQVRNQKCD
ncbi:MULTISPECIES: phosphoribosylamine--glycine ligase [Prochlorococcus]|uniref:phosphoribosylamine--glycine ligase n=1 Tax=Prochlorococcus TaxID=1218 RepID=UPI0005336DE4|nr:MULTISPECIES: phosphoribosylamine--glycine ligase [Prochlorococcus]KGG11933.1 Phosphoribosylamine--glycine ligase [Prochlorococcus sp. MIT 0601]